MHSYVHDSSQKEFNLCYHMRSPAAYVRQLGRSANTRCIGAESATVLRDPRSTQPRDFKALPGTHLLILSSEVWPLLG